ncbi:MAG: VOC family protein [Chloroflexota bacterium]|nr:VOC family protein [Chloroflexota bacterium]
MNITRFGSLNINAADFDATVKFYQDVLNAQVNVRHEVGGVAVARLGLGGVSIGLFDASQGDRPGVPHHTFVLEWNEDMDSVIRVLEERGVNIEGTRQHGDGPGYSVYVNDPSGNRIELSTDPN